ncbi:uncharacterized protein LOC144428271 [Styela clava]
MRKVFVHNPRRFVSRRNVQHVVNIAAPSEKLWILRFFRHAIAWISTRVRDTICGILEPHRTSILLGTLSVCIFLICLKLMFWIWKDRNIHEHREPDNVTQQLDTREKENKDDDCSCVACLRKKYKQIYAAEYSAKSTARKRLNTKTLSE